MAHPLETIMETTMARLKELVDVDMVVGKPVQVTDATMILPVSRISLGFVTGGGEYGTKNGVLKSGFALDQSSRSLPFAGTMTAGMNVKPVAFLCVQGDRVSVLPADTSEPLDRLIASMPSIAGEARALVESLRKGSAEQ